MSACYFAPASDQTDGRDPEKKWAREKSELCSGFGAIISPNRLPSVRCRRLVTHYQGLNDYASLFFFYAWTGEIIYPADPNISFKIKVDRNSFRLSRKFKGDLKKNNGEKSTIRFSGLFFFGGGGGGIQTTSKRSNRTDRTKRYAHPTPLTVEKRVCEMFCFGFR